MKPSWALIMRWPWLPPAALYVLALLVRAPLWRAPIYGDEAVLFYLSRHPLEDATNVHEFDTQTASPTGRLFWWRPLFRLLFVPSAEVSFDAYRTQYILVACLLVPLAYLLLRSWGARPAWAAGAAGAVALWPPLVDWGTVTFPDEPMTAAFALGLWAAARGRHAWSAVAFTASIWLKEVAAVGVGALLVLAVADEVRTLRARPHPWRPQARTGGLALAVVLGLSPLVYYMLSGGERPGWTTGGTGLDLVDRAFPVIWVLPLLLVGLAWSTTRAPSFVALVVAAFYFLYAFGLGGAVEAWYLVQPHFLSIVAAALVLQELGRRWPKSRAGRTWGVRLVTGILLVLLLVQVFAPAAWPAKRILNAPASGETVLSLPQTWRPDRAQGRNLEDLVAHLEPSDLRTAFLVDIGWFFIFYPFAERAGSVHYAYAVEHQDSRDELERWARLVEMTANVTVVGLYPPFQPLNQAMRNVYADCVAYANLEYVVLRGQACPGRAARLAQETERVSGTPLS